MFYALRKNVYVQHTNSFQNIIQYLEGQYCKQMVLGVLHAAEFLMSKPNMKLARSVWPGR